MSQVMNRLVIAQDNKHLNAYHIYTPYKQKIAQIIFPLDGQEMANKATLNQISKALAQRAGYVSTPKKRS